MKSMRWAAADLAISLGCAAAATVTPLDWAWLSPFAPPAPPDKTSLATPHQLPGSDNRFTTAQTQDMQRAVDWFPAEHPAMPPIVANGSATASACGFCHLPAGNGRPENSALAGLPADYIKRQITAFASGSRSSALPNAVPTQYMAAIAKALSPTEAAQAAAYFAGLAFTSHVRVIETTDVAFKPALFIYLPQPGPKQPLGERIIEGPDDPVRFDLRDPHTRYTAYVPPGSIAAGRDLVSTGGPAAQPCAMCHGTSLRGGIAPPLAGRSPTMILRQLVAFKLGTRSNPTAAPMRAIARNLQPPQMIALAAYAASLKP